MPASSKRQSREKQLSRLVMRRDSRARGITESLGIGIGLGDVFVAVTVVALDEAGGFLVQHGARGAQAQSAAADLAIREQVQLGFVDAGGIAPARSARAQAVRADAPVLHFVRDAEPQAHEGIRATFDARASSRAGSATAG